MENHDDDKRGFAPPFPDRLTEADYARFRAAPALRRAELAKSAPWPYRLLALLPNPKAPLEDWIASARIRARNRP
jgi:hypothetical protein